jgi:hypothetical protein
MTAKARMAHDPDQSDPDGTLDTVPPPQASKDPYGVQTRVGTPPAHLLEALRKCETDASLAKRTKSGMVWTAARRFAPPLPPSSARVPTPRPLRPSGERRIQRPPLVRPSPLEPLALHRSRVAVPTPPEGWLAGSATAPTNVPLTNAEAPAPREERPQPAAEPLVAPPRRGVARLLLVVAIFAVLGAAFAAATTLTAY